MHILKWIMTTVFTALIASGCASVIPENRSIMPLASGTSFPEPELRRLEGAIYAQNMPVKLFGDCRARNIGDIVTVNVVETSNASKKAATKTGRTTSVAGGISALLGYEGAIEDRNSRFSADSMIEGGISSDFDGSGTTTRNSTVTASISCRVVNVLPNGDLAIRGLREIRVNNETQHMILTGVIRPEDIAADNTILSSYVADARIEYNGRGVLSEKQSPGWLARILDYIWPL
ncbi:MAG: flagellar basal body L-ring protein FlgH [Thermodesulfobacteriota bacterium]